MTTCSTSESLLDPIRELEGASDAAFAAWRKAQADADIVRAQYPLRLGKILSREACEARSRAIALEDAAHRAAIVAAEAVCRAYRGEDLDTDEPAHASAER